MPLELNDKIFLHSLYGINPMNSYESTYGFILITQQNNMKLLLQKFPENIVKFGSKRYDAFIRFKKIYGYIPSIHELDVFCIVEI
jgi:hypothetical protein